MITVLQTDGLSHSEILGSKIICIYPKLIAAYHVLHRLREPRHPPDALTCFRLIFIRNKVNFDCGEELLILSAVILRFINLLSLTSYKSLLTVLCVNMSKISRSKERCGEYRGRTDDLLHAMQAL